MNYEKLCIVLFFLFALVCFYGASICHEQTEEAEKTLYDAVYNPVTNYWGSMSVEQYEQLNHDVNSAMNAEGACFIIGVFWLTMFFYLLVRPYISD